MDAQLMKDAAIPLLAFGIGAALLPNKKTSLPGRLAIFFGTQTGMNLYMKEVLSDTLVSEEEGLKGFPSAFIVTAMQQLVAFVLFGTWLLLSQLTPYAYQPKRLSSTREVLAVLVFSVSFTMNFALNNFSLSLVPLSVNLIIRSCLPLATFLSQRVACRCTGEPVTDACVIELGLMLLGVGCAALAVVAECHSGAPEVEGGTLILGIVCSILSLFSGAINLAMAGVLGTSVQLNSLDTTIYMAVPAFLLLCVPSFLYRHPVAWPDHGLMTDWDILMKVAALRPSVIVMALISGVFALFYNVFQYNFVQTLSASYTAFAGNFNKAATIAIGLFVGLETLPPGMWGTLMVMACLGGIAAFTTFSLIKFRTKGMPMQESSCDEDEMEDDYDSEDDETDTYKYSPATSASLGKYMGA